MLFQLLISHFINYFKKDATKCYELARLQRIRENKIIVDQNWCQLRPNGNSTCQRGRKAIQASQACCESCLEKVAAA
jgi:hypothetical protein